MKKNYLLTLFMVLALAVTQQGFSQSNANTPPVQQKIEGLTIFPNPAPVGKPYITLVTKRNLTKKIELFDVLGKRVHSVALSGKRLNISNLSKGVYILKVTEKEVSETRKLVIR